MPTEIEMPRYQCHKQCWALQSDGILRMADGSGLLSFVNRRYDQRKASADYMQKHDPHVGGYFVVYPDGYQSFSPAAGFESGYTLIEK